MIGRPTDWLLGLVGGLFLALMVDYNSALAAHSNSVYASWVAHGLGALVAVFLVLAYGRVLARSAATAPRVRAKAPFWFYLGGVPGAFTVILAAIVVNSRLTLSSSIALMLLGQVIFGIVADHLGLFRTPRRRLVPADFVVSLSILAGSALIVYGGQ